MKKQRILALILVFMLCLCTALPALAATAGDKRVAIAADLTAEERSQIYKDFGISEGSVPEIIVTNADERAYLSGLIDEKKIGNVALSCVYIEIMAAGQGLTVLTNNINYCTPDMYRNALTTAGISDARVMVSAPKPVSGTAALTGIYKAYEAISGNSLSELAKNVGAEELVVTGNLAEYIGSADATAMINELKGILDQTVNMTDDQVREQINTIAGQYNIQINDAQRDQILKLCRSLEKLDANQLREKLVSLGETVQKAGAAKEKLDQFAADASSFAQKVQNLASKVGGFFKNLFGK